MNIDTRHPLLKLRDEGFDAARKVHSRIKHDIGLYRNQPYSGEDWISGFERIVQKPLDPKIPVTIQRLIPAFTEGIPKIEVRPKRDVDYYDVKILERFLEINEDQDQEALRIETMVYHNQIMGTAIRYVWWDPSHHVVRTKAVHPLSFALDPACTQPNFQDADYLVWRQAHSTSYIERKYPKFQFRNRKPPMDGLNESINVDLIYMRPERAEQVGVKVTENTDLVLATVIEDEVYQAIGNPTVWPDYPFSAWRNFLDIDTTGRPQSFWGTGYSSLIEPLQKVYDDMLANFLFIVRNIKTGRTMAEFGVIDPDSYLNQHGGLIELEEHKRLDQARELPNAEAPISLQNAIGLIQELITNFAPSLSPIFVGESPGANTSGRALSTLQSAAFNQLSDNMRAFNEERKRTARIRLNLIQEHAGYGKSNPQLGSGIGGVLEESTRHVGFDITLPDPSGLPQTVAGKVQVLAMLSQMGYMVAPELLVDLIGLDTGYGLTPDKLVSMAQQAAPPGGPAGGTQAAQGVETVPPAEM